jgi:cbb3-type cytochrome oxidase subunit 3
MHLDLGIVRGVITVVWLLLFIALWLSAWSKGRRKEFEAAALLPFDASDPLPEREERR